MPPETRGRKVNAGIVATTQVLSGSTRRPPPEETPIRCLFINWNDNDQPSQFTVGKDYTLAGRGLDSRRRRSLLGRRKLPKRLTVFNTDDLVHAEMYLDLDRIRSAYLIDIGPDQRITT